jgi:tetratricopeptide (TPR) repeat protein
MVDSSKELPVRIARFRSLHQESPAERYFAPLADLLRQAGCHDEALELLDAGLALHSGYLAGLVIQGRTLVEVGRPDEARDVWEQVLAVDQDNLLALEFLSERTLERQEWEKAIPLLDRLCRLMGQDSRWTELRKHARIQMTRAATGAVPEPASQGEQGTSFDTMTLVDIYLAQGYRDRALAVLRRMLPGSGDAREEILERIRVLEEVDDDPGERVPVGDPGSEAGMAKVRESLRHRTGSDRSPSSQSERMAREEERSQRRATERKQFEEWLEKIRFNGGHGA